MGTPAKARNHLTTHIGQDYVAVLREGQTTDDAIVTIKYPSKADIALAKQFAAAPDMLEALQEAVVAIRAFNGMGMPKDVEQKCWDAYQHSPEMKRINAAIAKATGAG